MPRRDSLLHGHLALLVVTLLWGFGLPSMRLVVAALGPDGAVAARFGLAAVCVLPLALRQLRSRVSAWAGIRLGLLSALLYACLSRALHDISTPRASFLLGTSVVWVALLSFLVHGVRLPWRDWAATGVCLLGLATLTGFRADSFAPGDLYALAAGLWFGLAIVVLHEATQQPGVQGPAVIFYEMLTVTCLSLPAALWTWPTTVAWTPALLLAWFYNAAFGTVAAALLQIRYQRTSSPTVAAVIYALKPGFTCACATLVFGEPLAREVAAGGALILLASLLPQMVAWRTAGSPLP